MIYPNGLGDANTQLAQYSGVVLSTAGSAVAPVAAGALSFGAGISTSLAVPIVGAAIAGVTLLIGGWLSGIAKHNAEKTAATKIVNEAEPYLKQNLAAFQGLASPTVSDQNQALANFDNIWAQVVQACSNNSLEDAGKRCISDRSAGGPWNWFAYYRDPIASASVQPDSLTQQVLHGNFNQVVSTVSANPVLYGAIGLVLLLIISKGGHRG